MSGDLDTSQLRAAFVQAQAQIMNNGEFTPVVVIDKALALGLLDEIERLRADVADLKASGLALCDESDAFRTERDAERAEVERLRAEVERLMDGMELAWGLIANGQYWDRTDGRKYGEWNEARLKWRDEHWHPALGRNKETRREQ